MFWVSWAITLLLWGLGPRKVLASAQISVPDLPGCQPVAITWTGGTGPYHVWVIQSGQDNATPLEDFGVVSAAAMVWVVNIPVGSSVTFALQDQTGQTVYSDPRTIGQGSCPAPSTTTTPPAPPPSTAPAPAPTSHEPAPTSSPISSSTTTQPQPAPPTSTPTSTPTPSVVSNPASSSISSSSVSLPGVFSGSGPVLALPSSGSGDTTSSSSRSMTISLVSMPSGSWSSGMISETLTISGSTSVVAGVPVTEAGDPESAQSNKPSSSINGGKIAGLAIGIVSLVSALGFVVSIIYCSRRRRRQGSDRWRKAQSGLTTWVSDNSLTPIPYPLPSEKSRPPTPETSIASVEAHAHTHQAYMTESPTLGRRLSGNSEQQSFFAYRPPGASPIHGFATRSYLSNSTTDPESSPSVVNMPALPDTAALLPDNRHARNDSFQNYDQRESFNSTIAYTHEQGVEDNSSERNSISSLGSMLPPTLDRLQIPTTTILGRKKLTPINESPTSLPYGSPRSLLPTYKTNTPLSNLPSAAPSSMIFHSNVSHSASSRSRRTGAPSTVTALTRDTRFSEAPTGIFTTERGYDDDGDETRRETTFSVPETRPTSRDFNLMDDLEWQSSKRQTTKTIQTSRTMRDVPLSAALTDESWMRH
ncbi:hypothetical protein M231_01912 [Tremella mesenterica]|uniref:Uncharacterized protein n=1 Tax=Tremella mesenterica TaxID=5217 RepID=A0A4Q1BS70_TREME|nr:hypothetical protein M231_01912 [Tremella mesenterica]